MAVVVFTEQAYWKASYPNMASSKNGPGSKRLDVWTGRLMGLPARSLIVAEWEARVGGKVGHLRNYGRAPE